MENRHKDSCTTESPFERWGDVGGYDTRLSDGGLSVWEAAQANPGCNTLRREGTWNPRGEADCLIPYYLEKPLARWPVSVP
jgi:hypothetical protein